MPHVAIKISRCSLEYKNSLEGKGYDLKYNLEKEEVFIPVKNFERFLKKNCSSLDSSQSEEIYRSSVICIVSSFSFIMCLHSSRRTWG